MRRFGNAYTSGLISSGVTEEQRRRAVGRTVGDRLSATSDPGQERVIDRRLFCPCVGEPAPVPEPDLWARYIINDISATFNVYYSSVATDTTGRSIVIGENIPPQSPILFLDTSANIQQSLSYPVTSDTNSFVSVYDTFGNCVWVAKFYVINSSYSQLLKVVTDQQDNIYIYGIYINNVSSSIIAYSTDNVSFITKLTTGINSTAFVIKYSPTGSVQWIAQIENGINMAVRDITVLSNNDIVVCGSYYSPSLPDTIVIDDGLGSTSATLQNSNNNKFGYVVGFNPNGSCIYAKSITCGSPLLTDYVEMYQIVSDTNSFVVSANANTSISTVCDTISLGGTGNDQLILFTFDYSGNPINGIYTSAANFNLLSTNNPPFSTLRYGYFSATASDISNLQNIYDQDNNLVASVPISAAGSIYIYKYNPLTNVYDWATHIEGTNNRVVSLSVGLTGEVYVAIKQSSPTIDFYNSSGSLATTLTKLGGDTHCLAIACYEISGNLRWARMIGGTKIANLQVNIHNDTVGNICIFSSYFTGPVRFYDASEITILYTLSSLGTYGTFLTKYSPQGSFLWASQVGPSGSSTDNVWSVSSINNSVYTISNTIPGTVFVVDANAVTRFQINQPISSYVGVLVRWPSSGS